VSAFGSRLVVAVAGFDGGAAFAGDAAFVAPVFAGEVFAVEVFAGAAFAVGFATALAVAAFAAGAVLAGFAPVPTVAGLAPALPCPSAAAGFETAFADAFTGAFDAFATRSSSTIPVRPFLVAYAAPASE